MRCWMKMDCDSIGCENFLDEASVVMLFCCECVQFEVADCWSKDDAIGRMQILFTGRTKLPAGV